MSLPSCGPARKAANIVVVKDGTVHAQGTHEKLLETCPLYRDMWQAHIGAKDQM